MKPLKLCVYALFLIAGGVFFNNIGKENRIVSVNTLVLETRFCTGSFDLVELLFAVNIYCQKYGGSILFCNL